MQTTLLRMCSKYLTLHSEMLPILISKLAQGLTYGYLWLPYIAFV